MRQLQSHPNIATLIFAAILCLTVFAVQTWMTDRYGHTDVESSLTNPPD
jgi:sensor domain CHASE-containing protein